MAAAPVMNLAASGRGSAYHMSTREERIANGLMAAVLTAGLSAVSQRAALFSAGLFILLLSSGGITGAAVGALISAFGLLLGGLGARSIALCLLSAGAAGCVRGYGPIAQAVMFLTGLPLSMYLGWDAKDAFFLGAACVYPLIPAWVSMRFRALFIVRTAEEAPPLTVSAFRRHAPPAGAKICGDSGAIERLSGGRMLVMLADGMGMGKPAREMSLRAVETAKAFLGANVEKMNALGAVNRMTMGEEERYSTLDACVIDLYSGRAEFYKSGGEPAWVISKGMVTRIESESLPLGVMLDAPPMIRKMRLKPGDCVFMATDGLINALGGADSVECALIRLHSCAPGSICRSMLREAGKNPGHARADDMSVLCVRMEKRGAGRRRNAPSVFPLPGAENAS